MQLQSVPLTAVEITQIIFDALKERDGTSFPLYCLLAHVFF